MRNRLEKITLKGFKTIESLEDFEPGPLTVLIGPNGAGKSNFISFFRMLSWALSDPGPSSDLRRREWWRKRAVAWRTFSHIGDGNRNSLWSPIEARISTHFD